MNPSAKTFALVLVAAAAAGVFTGWRPTVGSEGVPDARTEHVPAPDSGRARVEPATPRATARTARPDGLIIDPSDPGYDAIAVRHGLQKSPREIFELEPRKEPWASVHEKLFAEQVGADLARASPSARIDRVECHTQSCAVHLVTPATEENRTLLGVQLISYSHTFGVGGGDEDLGDGKVRFPFHLVLSVRERDEDPMAYRKRMHEHWRMMVEQAKSDPDFAAQLARYGITLPPG
jgi:hypothetical protein